MSHHIDPQVLRRAAENLQIILDAGYSGQLDSELLDATDYDESFRHRESARRWQQTLAINEVDTFARRLAAIADCPVEQARGVALDLLGRGERRAVGLRLLADLAQRVRRLQAQTRRRAS